MLRVEKVATPAEAFRVLVPLKVAPAVPEPGVIAMVTLPVKLVTVFPKRVLPRDLHRRGDRGTRYRIRRSTVKTSWLNAAAVMLKAVLVAPVRPFAAAVSV